VVPPLPSITGGPQAEPFRTQFAGGRGQVGQALLGFYRFTSEIRRRVN